MLTQIINGKILTPQGWLTDGSVLIQDNKILEVTNCDLAIVGSDSITIQLYHIKLDGVKPVDYPDDAYSLAISYPESFATNYVLSEQANQEDEDVEDDD